MRLRTFLTVLLIWYSAASLAAQTHPEQPATAEVTPPPIATGAGEHASEFADRNPRYTLRAGDVMELTFEFSNEYNQTVTVQPDGYISLRGIAEVQVGGKTLPDTTAAIVAAYGKILNQPSISVVLKDFEKPFFLVTGQVTKPGKYDLRSDTTLTQAIAIAGGFNDMARHSQVVLFHRISNEWYEAKLYNVKEMFNNRDMREDPLLHPGDLVVVPQSTYSKMRRYIPAPGLGVSVSPF